MHVNDLDTPMPVVDLDVALRNLHRMQAYCDEYGLALRPHIKTHKLPYFARKQLELGAVGIACQKISEAAVMAQAGISDIFLTYNIVGNQKIEPLTRLASFTNLSVGIDNAVALRTVEAAAHHASRSIGVLVEFDAGLRRTGVSTAEEALELAQQVERSPHVEFKGLMCYPSTEASGRWLEKAIPLLEKVGLSPRVISGGGTPNAHLTHQLPHVTELRVGTYVYNDRMMIHAGAASLEDCALTVKATVVSRSAPDRAVIDAGSKTLSSDRVAAENVQGFGLILEYPDVIIKQIYEEHGVLDLSSSREKPEVGDVVTVIPNHACVVTNLHDEVAFHQAGNVISKVPVAARGKTV